MCSKDAGEISASHPYELTAEAVLEPNAHNASADEVKNLDFELPAGLTLDPSAVPQCTYRELTEGECPGSAAVGVAQMSVAGTMESATVYNLVPAPGEPAELGFTLGGVPTIVDVNVRTASDYGMTLSMRDISNSKVESVTLTLGGAPYSAFLTLPTSCAGPLQTTLQGESWGADTASLSVSFPQMNGCGQLSFDPSLNVVPEVTVASEPSGYQVQLSVPQDESPEVLATAQPRNTSVTLPAGTSLSLSATDGLEACSEAQVGLGLSWPATCLAASTVGEVEIQTPLLASPLDGRLYLASPNANPFGSLLALYLVAEGSGVSIKLAGEVEANPATGQLTIVLHELPQLPIGELNLHFYGGARALLANPPACGLATSTSELTPWSGTLGVTASNSFEITSGANGTPCSDPQPFSPAFQAGSTTNEAGAYDSLTFLVSRAAQEEELDTIALQAPPAVAEMFTGVPPCGEPQAAQGTCPAVSEIGIVDLAVGSGPEPYYLSGDVYLTGPYRGASQGLSIVVPFDAGPFELGTVVIRASEQIDPGTGQMTILSDPLPTIIDGIPLRLQALALQLDR